MERGIVSLQSSFQRIDGHGDVVPAALRCDWPKDSEYEAHMVWGLQGECRRKATY